MAANLYADASNVILAGTLFMRPSFYTALTYMARGQPVETCRLPDHDVQRIMVGEHRNLLLQAICRGQARKLDGTRCPPMDAYIIASRTSGISKALEDVFPGCRLQCRAPLQQRLTGKLKEAVDYIEATLATGLQQVPLN